MVLRLTEAERSESGAEGSRAEGESRGCGGGKEESTEGEEGEGG